MSFIHDPIQVDIYKKLNIKICSTRTAYEEEQYILAFNFFQGNLKIKRSKDKSTFLSSFHVLLYLPCRSLSKTNGYIHTRKHAQEMPRFIFQNVYLLVLPLITSLFTVVCHPSVPLNHFSKQRCLFLPSLYQRHFRLMSFSCYRACKVKQSALIKDIQHYVYRFLQRADYTHTHSPLSHNTGLV